MIKINEEVTADNRAIFVNDVMLDCLFKKDEVPNGKVPPDAIVVEGIRHKFAFNPKRISENKESIRKLTLGLPQEFYQKTGGGWSFLNLCNDAKGRQWGEHINMEALCVLAIAAKLGKWVLPKEMWKVLPGEMPYFVFSEE